MNFSKMHGNGNDFIVIEDLDNNLVGREEKLAKHICHRRFGIGADGILLVRRNVGCDIEMVIINSDGSYAAMCGNGIRCFAKYVYEKAIVQKQQIDVLTGAGIKKVFFNIDENNKVIDMKVNMGYSDFNPKSIPAISDEEIIEKSLCINNKTYNINSLLMNIPHTVIFENEETDINEGKEIEKFSMFPQRTNVNFCKVINEDTIRVRTWERGAGPTLACGTGNCAAAVVANKLGYVGKNINIIVPGGQLKVSLEDDGVYMIGDAQFICEGSYIFREGE